MFGKNGQKCVCKKCQPGTLSDTMLSKLKIVAKKKKSLAGTQPEQRSGRKQKSCRNEDVSLGHRSMAGGLVSFTRGPWSWRGRERVGGTAGLEGGRWAGLKCPPSSSCSGSTSRRSGRRAPARAGRCSRAPETAQARASADVPCACGPTGTSQTPVCRRRSPAA